jgi:NADH:ubiquinone oxidoreductase subunit 6 (subunit J)
MRISVYKSLKGSIIICKFAVINMNHLQKEKQKTKTRSMVIIAIIAALGLLGVVIVTIVTIQQVEAAGCRNPIALSNSRELCSDIPNGPHPPSFVHP